MTLYIVKGRTQTKDGKIYEFNVVRENFWDKKTKAMRQRYVCYLGKTKQLTLAKAKAICKAKQIKLDDLKAVKGLEIIEG